jgi:hypothetical protein
LTWGPLHLDVPNFLAKLGPNKMSILKWLSITKYDMINKLCTHCSQQHINSLSILLQAFFFQNCNHNSLNYWTHG